ncbi:thiolase family protein [Chloroflexota bacterium]
MKEVAIVGVGIHKFGRFGDKPYTEIGLDAVKMALKDANLSWRDMQVGYCARCYLPSSTGARIGMMLGKTGISISDVEAACASGGVALRQGMLAIQSGAYDIAIVLGVEKMPRGFMEPETLGYERWQVQTGLCTNPSYWSMSARRHMHDYGTTDLQIAKIAYKNHRNSVYNPYAMYQKEFSIEEILGSPVVCDPIHLLEICAPNEGAAALVMCSKEIAHKYASKPITIASCGHNLSLYSSDFRGPTTQLSAKISNPNQCITASREAYEEAGIGPEDIDVAEVQDTDAFMELVHYEELGFCNAGEGGRLVDEGATEIGGKIPVNTSGGLICKGEPIGASHIGQLVDLVWQLRGENGQRQVNNAKVALALVTGAMGHCAVTILKK